MIRFLPLHLFEERKRLLFADDHQVDCPRQGNIDVERCFGCEWFVRADFTVEHPWIMCRVPRELYSARRASEIGVGNYRF